MPVVDSGEENRDMGHEIGLSQRTYIYRLFCAIRPSAIRAITAIPSLLRNASANPILVVSAHSVAIARCLGGNVDLKTTVAVRFPKA